MAGCLGAQSGEPGKWCLDAAAGDDSGERKMHFGVDGDECKFICRSCGGVEGACVGKYGVAVLGVAVTVPGAEAAEDPSTAWRRPGAEAGAGRGT